MLNDSGLLFGTIHQRPQAVWDYASRNLFGFITGLLTALLLLAPAVHAQAPGAQPAEQAGMAQPADKALMEVSKLNERIEAIQGSSDVDEAAKARLLDVYKQTVAFVKERNKNAKEAEELSAFVKVTGPGHIEEIREKEGEFKPFDPLTVAPLAEKMSLQDLKNKVDDETATLNELVARIDNAAGDLESAENRRDETSAQISQIEEKLKKIREQPVERSPDPQASELTEALLLKQTAERQMLNTELTARRQEGLSIPLRLNVLTAEKELLAQQKKNAEKRLEAWREALAQRKEAQSKKRIIDASAVLKKAEAEEWPPFLLGMARKNVTGSQAMNTLNNNANMVESDISELKEKLAQVKDDYERTRKRVKSIGLTPTAGVFFGRNLRTLSGMRVPTGAAAKRRREIRRVTEEQLMLEELRDEVSSLDGTSLKPTPSPKASLFPPHHTTHHMRIKSSQR